MTHQNPSPEEIRRLLDTVRSIAIVGLSPDPERDSHHVAEGLQRMGYRVLPVRPGGGEILGERVWPDLASVTEPIDMVDVFRAPQHVDAIVEACLQLGVRRLWLQDGVINEAAAARARESGMTVVMDRCLWRDAVGLRR